MSLLPRLIWLARQCQCAWLPQRLAVGSQSALRCMAAAPPPLPPGSARHASGGGGGRASSSRSSSSSHHCDGSCGRPKRAVAAGAGRRGNVFLNDSGAGQTKKPQELGEYVQEPTAASLFDSSRFNYDSDEEEAEVEQQQGQADDGEEGSAAMSTSSAWAAAGQQQRSALRRAGGGTTGEATAELAAELAAGGVVLPPARGVKVKSAEFVKSSVTVEQCPPARFPEFAVIGRSNVGKSSLINMLTGRNALAMVSKTPGKTRCINHFIINGAWYLVDLPGYGYARTSKTNAVEWTRFTREYFLDRESLVTVLLLVDASIPPMPLDIASAAWFAEAEIPFTIVFTKLDKRKKGVTPSDDNIAAFKQAVSEACGYLPPTILTSSKSGKGRSELLSHVAQLRDFYNKSRHGM